MVGWESSLTPMVELVISTFLEGSLCILDVKLLLNIWLAIFLYYSVHAFFTAEDGLLHNIW